MNGIIDIHCHPTIKMYLYEGTEKERDLDGNNDTKRWWKLGEMKAWAMEVLVSIDSSYHDQNFSQRAALPHHNEIAVDGEEKDALHGLYEHKPNAPRNDRVSFENQFRWRKNTAINHIRKAYQNCMAGIV